VKRTRWETLVGPERGTPSGFMAMLRTRCKMFPEWVEITDYFGEYRNLGPYRTRAGEKGFILRRKDGKVYACIAPRAAPTATKGHKL